MTRSLTPSHLFPQVLKVFSETFFKSNKFKLDLHKKSHALRTWPKPIKVIMKTLTNHPPIKGGYVMKNPIKTKGDYAMKKPIKFKGDSEMEHTTTENKHLKEKIIPTIKVIYNGKNRPFMIPREIVLDEGLSLEALGVYVRLLSFEEDDVTALTLSKMWNEPVGFIQECLQELEDRVYLRSVGGES